MSKTRSPSKGRVSQQLLFDSPAFEGPGSPAALGGRKSAIGCSTPNSKKGGAKSPARKSGAAAAAAATTGGGDDSILGLKTPNTTARLTRNSTQTNVHFIQMESLTRFQLLIEPFIARLKKHQPTFEDEDVAAPKLITGPSGSAPGTRSPSRRHDDDVDPEAVDLIKAGLFRTSSFSDVGENGSGDLGGVPASPGGSQGIPASPLAAFIAASPSSTTGGALREDQALTDLGELFEKVDPVKLQEAKKQHQAAAALECVKDAYKYLVSLDQQYRKKRGGARGRKAVATNGTSAFDKSSSFGQLNNTMSSFFSTSSASLASAPPLDVEEQLLQARTHAWMLLAQVVECLIVYGNKNEALLTELMSKSENLVICLKLMEKAKFLATDSPFDATNVKLQRDPAEIEELEAQLIENDVPEVLLGKLVMSYAQEFLMDAAVPPAVCSGRYEAANDHAFKQKGALCTAMLNTKCGPFLQQLVEESKYDHLASLCAFALCAKYKTRQRFCERLAGEHSLFGYMATNVFQMPGASSGPSLPAATPRRSGAATTTTTSSTTAGSATAIKRRKAKAAKQQQQTSTKLLKDEDLLTHCLDILTVFSQPDEDEDPADNGTPHRKRKSPAWASHPDLPLVLEGCFNLLSDIPAEAEQKGSKGLYVVKISTFLEYCLDLNSAVILEKMIELINGTLDQVFCGSPSRLLPLMAKVLEAPLLLKRNREDWMATVSTWYGTLTIHAGYSQSSTKYRNRANCRKIEPFFRFATNLCTPKEPLPFLDGAKDFLERTLVTAVVVQHMYEARGNLLYSVALNTVKALRNVKIEPSPKLYPSPALLTAEANPFSSNPLLVEAMANHAPSPAGHRILDAMTGNNKTGGRSSGRKGGRNSGGSPARGSSSRGKRGRSSDPDNGSSPVPPFNMTPTAMPDPVGSVGRTGSSSFFMRDEQTPATPTGERSGRGSSGPGRPSDGGSVSPTLSTTAALSIKNTWAMLTSFYRGGKK